MHYPIGIQPSPFVMQLGPQDLHCASVLYVKGAFWHTYVAQAETVLPFPEQGPSKAVNLGQVSIVP